MMQMSIMVDFLMNSMVNLVRMASYKRQELRLIQLIIDLKCETMYEEIINSVDDLMKFSSKHFK
jgi:hypothetical protein